MNKGAIISDCGQYRYQLWRIWNDKPRVLFICLNPSTADARQDDPTLRRLIGFSYQLGFGGLYLGNLFAYRSTYPSDLIRPNNPVGLENDHHLLRMAAFCRETVFAWGNDGALLDRHQQVISMFPDAMCLGITKTGQPKHPLYLPKDSQLIKFT